MLLCLRWRILTNIHQRLVRRDLWVYMLLVHIFQKLMPAEETVDVWKMNKYNKLIDWYFNACKSKWSNSSQTHFDCPCWSIVVSIPHNRTKRSMRSPSIFSRSHKLARIFQRKHGILHNSFMHIVGVGPFLPSFNTTWTFTCLHVWPCCFLSCRIPFFFSFHFHSFCPFL